MICLSFRMQDVYFDDDSAEVVISSLRLGDDQGRYVDIFFIYPVIMFRRDMILLFYQAAWHYFYIYVK